MKEFFLREDISSAENTIHYWRFSLFLFCTHIGKDLYRILLDYLNSLDIEFDLLSDEIVIFHMDKTFKQFKEYPEKNKQKISFYGKLQNHFSQKRHDIFQTVDTESNVGFMVLNKLLGQFSLEKFPEYWEQYTYPNPNLKETLDTFIRYRNGVAHGGDISSEEKVTQEVYMKYRKLMGDLMYAMHDRFMKGIQKQTYLRDSESLAEKGITKIHIRQDIY